MPPPTPHVPILIIFTLLAAVVYFGFAVDHLRSTDLFPVWIIGLQVSGLGCSPFALFNQLDMECAIDRLGD